MIGGFLRRSLTISTLLLVFMGILLISSCSPQTAKTTNGEEATRFMYDLSSGVEARTQSAIDSILAAEDRRFVAVFIELIRAYELGIIFVPDAYNALETLSGESFTYWSDWIEWYGATDLKPPPGFTSWKGNIFARIDYRFDSFLNDDAPSDIRVEEILWGGVLVDGIPALDNPTMIPAGKAEYLEPEDPVFGIVVGGDARAYPLRIMDWHEMANDIIGGIPVSLSYCTLCGAAIAYDGRASDGQTYTFGSSGLLFRSNKLMYDRQTRTLWNQITGEPVLGDLVGTGIELDLVPVVLTTWKEWQIQHSNTVVLDIETGFDRPYVLGAAYGGYFSSDSTMFPVWQRSELLNKKSQIYALTVDGLPKAYPIDILAEEKVVNDTVGDMPVVIVATRGIVNVSGSSTREGPVNYIAGSEVRAYNRGAETFSPGPNADTVLDAAGQPWQVTEEALIGTGGEQAPRISGHLAYWFGWFAFFPQTLVYGQ